VVFPPGHLPAMMRMIAGTRPNEIDCDACFEQVGRFVELVMAGQNASAALPLVQQHLEQCRDCREEFEALLAALQTSAAGAAQLPF
jgi:predicted anti-sigma-YlaC factor YlaD